MTNLPAPYCVTQICKMLGLLVFTVLAAASRPADANFQSTGVVDHDAQQLYRSGAQVVADAAASTLKRLGSTFVRHLADATQPDPWPHGYFAICVVTKNQQIDIREWLHYHRWLGVGKVYLYDDNSTQPIAEGIKDFIESQFVEYHYFIGKPGNRKVFTSTKQYKVYETCVERHARFHRWMAFIDSDEFIVLHPNATTININTFMSRYEKYGALGVNWVLFGSSGHIHRPQGGCLKNFNKCIPPSDKESTHVKIIANTQYLKSPAGNPHSVVLSGDATMVNEKLEVVPNLYGATSPWTPASSVDQVALYHYVIKSREDFIKKAARGSPTNNRKGWPYFDKIEKLATDTCSYGHTAWEMCCKDAVF